MCVALLDVVAFLLAAAPEIMQIDQGLYGVAITAFVTVIHVASSPKYVFELKKLKPHELLRQPSHFSTTRVFTWRGSSRCLFFCLSLLEWITKENTLLSQVPLWCCVKRRADLKEFLPDIAWLWIWLFEACTGGIFLFYFVVDFEFCHGRAREQKVFFEVISLLALLLFPSEWRTAIFPWRVK